MERKQKNTLEERMAARGERPVLLLSRTKDASLFRYGVGRSEADPPLYSVYVEYRWEGTHTASEIPAFSPDRDRAESFCILLERVLATPLSLEAIYEDSLTP